MQSGEQWHSLTQLSTPGWTCVSTGRWTQSGQDNGVCATEPAPAIGQADFKGGHRPEIGDAETRKTTRPGKKKKRIQLAKRNQAVEATRQMHANACTACQCREIWSRNAGPRAMLYIGDGAYAVGTQALLVDFYAVAVVWVDGHPIDAGRPWCSVAPASNRVCPAFQQDNGKIRPPPRRGVMVASWLGAARCHRVHDVVTLSPCLWQVNALDRAPIGHDEPGPNVYSREDIPSQVRGAGNK